MKEHSRQFTMTRNIYNQIKIITCLFFLTTLLLLLRTGISAATPHGFSFSAVDYNILEDTGTGDIILQNGDVEPGQVFQLDLMYEVGDPTFTSMQFGFNFNKDLIEPIVDGGQVYFEMSGTTYQDGIFPSRSTIGAGRNQTNWVMNANFVDQVTYGNGIYATLRDTTYEKPLETSGKIASFWFMVKEDAPPGAVINISYNTEYTTITGNYDFVTDSYQLNVFGEMSGDNSLATLDVSSSSQLYSLSPTFVPGNTTVTSYSAVVPNHISNIDIAATATDEYASVLAGSIGNKALAIGDNSFEIIVQSQNGHTQIYELIVRRLSNNADLASISFTNSINLSSFDPAITSYSLNIPYSKDSTSVSASLLDENAAIVSGAGNWNLTNFGSTPNSRGIVVNAENCDPIYSTVPGNNCSSKTYSLTIYREDPSTNNNLTSILTDGNMIPGFNPATLIYDLGSVPNNKTSININAVVEDTGKAVIISGLGNHNLNVGNNSFDILVQAEDGSTKTYSVSIRRLSSNSDLSSLSITSSPSGTLSPAFQGSFKGKYTYTYPPSVTSINITANPSDPNAFVDVNGTGTNSDIIDNSTTNIDIIVTAEDGSISTYSIDLTRQLSNDNTLSELSISPGALNETFAPSTSVYTASVNGSVTSVNVSAQTNDEKAEVQSITGNTFLSYGNNIVTVRVVSESGLTRDYVITITRNRKTIATLDDLLIEGISLNSFDPSVFTYSIPDVSFSTTSLGVSYVLSDEDATAGISGNSSLNTGNNTISIVVTAHDGITTNTYSVNVFREYNNDATVSSLLVAGLTPTYDSTNDVYEITVPNNKTSILPAEVVITPSDTNASITKDPTLNLNTGTDNFYEFTIIAENGVTAETYTINITREQSANNQVSRIDLTADTYTATCTISGGICSLTIPPTTSEVELVATLADPTATISTGLNGTHSTLSSLTEIPFTVTAENGDVANYTVRIARLKSSNSNLSSLTINDISAPDFSANKQVYNITYPSSVVDADIQAVVADTGKATLSGDIGVNSLSFGLNTFEVIVTAEDETTTKTYTLNITRNRGTDATLADLRINGSTISGFNPSTLTYNLGDLPYNTLSILIHAEVNDPLASVANTNLGTVNLETGDNAIEIVVTAHDTSITETYIINVHREKNDDASIQNVSINSINATLVEGTNPFVYEITLPNNISTISPNDVIVTLTDTNASIDKDSTINLSTTDGNIYKFRVTSENELVEEEYTINITRTKSNIATLDTLTVTNGSFSPSFNKDIKEYNVTVPLSETSVTVAATKTDLTSNILSGLGVFTLTESNIEIEIVVVAENEVDIETYTLNISREKSGNNNLASLTVDSGTLSPTFNKNTTNYTVTVPGNIEEINVEAALEDYRATLLSGDGIHNLNVGQNTIEVVVENEQGTTKTYTIIVTREQKNINTLNSITVDSVEIEDFDPDTLTYNLDPVPYEKTSVNIAAVVTDLDAQIISGTGGINLSTGNNTLNIVVRAQNGDLRTYSINVSREENNVATLKQLSFSGQVLIPAFNENIFTYSINVPNNITQVTQSNIIAVPTDSNATVIKDQTKSLVAGVQTTYEITVTSENGLVENTYTLNITRALSNNARLSSLSINPGSISPAFNPNTLTYTATVPFGTTNYTINATAEDSTAEILGTGQYDSDTNSVTVVVTAQDGTIRNYIVNIVVASSNDATLSSLNIPGYVLSPTFSSTTINYNIGNIPYSTQQLSVNAIASNTNATIKYIVDGIEFTNNVVTIPEELGTGTIKIEVTAPDGVTKRIYTIGYTKIASSNAFLISLESSVGDLTPTFTKTLYDYTINVDSNITDITLNATAEDLNATITHDANTTFASQTISLENLNIGSNPVTITITAQDGTIANYNIVINRATPTASSNAMLSNLSITDETLDPIFNPENNSYDIGTILFTKDLLTINASPIIGASNIQYFVNGVLQNDNNVLIPRQGGTVIIEVRVTAEDNQTRNSYYITLNKQPSADAYLSSLVTDVGELDPNFNPDTLNYIIEIDPSVTEVNIVPTLENASSTLEINSQAHSNSTEYSVEITENRHTVSIIVTAEDGLTSNLYSVDIYHVPNIPEVITSEIYGHDINEEYILTTVVETTPAELKDQLDNENQYLEIWDSSESNIIGSSNKLATGMIVKLVIDGDEKDRKIIVILGDANGDGNINTLDARTIVNHVLQTIILTGPYLRAADATQDSNVNTLDARRIVNHVLQIQPLF